MSQIIKILKFAVKALGDPLLLFLNILLGINVILDQRSGFLHGGAWLIAFTASFTSPILSLGLLVGTAAWWDIPLLRLGFPNQFLTDILTLGWASGLALHLRANDRRTHLSKADSPLPNFLFDLQDPFRIWATLTLVLVICYLFTSTIELALLSGAGFSIKNFLLTIGERGFDWAIEGHLISRYGAFIGLGVLTVLAKNLSSPYLNLNFVNFKKTALICVIICSTANFLYAIGQLFHFPFTPTIYTVDIGGLTQNGNHLSYVGLIILIATTYAASDARNLLPSNKAIRIVTLSIGYISSIGMIIIGYGRSSWLGLAGGLVIGVLSIMSKVGNTKKNIKLLVSIIIALCVFTFAVTKIGINLPIPGTYSNAAAEIKELIFHPSIQRLYTAGGRAQHYAAAWTDFTDNPWTGIGYDAFFMRHPFQLEIHSLPLKLLAEGGVLGGFVFICFLLSIISVTFGSQSRTSKGRLSSSAIATGGIAAIFIPLLADAFLSFRGIATMVGAVSFILVHELRRDTLQADVTSSIPRVKSNDLVSIRSLSYFLALSAIILSILVGPPTIPRFTIAYDNETEKEYKFFNWRTMVIGLPNPEQGLPSSSSCIEILLKSPLNRGKYLVAFERLSSTTFSTLSTHNLAFTRRVFENSQKKFIDFNEGSSPWHNVCICPFATSDDSSVVAFVNNGDIISFTKNRPNHDLRFIGLGLGPITRLPLNGNKSNCVNL